MSTGKNQDKRLRDLNWTNKGLELSLIADDSEKYYGRFNWTIERVYRKKNQNKSLIDLNWTSRGLELSLTGDESKKS